MHASTEKAKRDSDQHMAELAQAQADLNTSKRDRQIRELLRAYSVNKR